MKHVKTILFATAALAVLGACGGQSSNTSSSSSGASASRVTRGALTSVSSAGAPQTISLNGSVIDDSGATIKVDDNPTGHEALQAGMVVTVKVDDNGKATEIQHHAQMRGRVDAKGASTITIGGASVHVDDSTHFEDNVNRLAGINANDRIRVSGFPDDRGGLRATHIGRDLSTEFEFEVHGIVSNLDPAAKTFDLKLSAAAATSFSVSLESGVSLPAGIADGSIVEVKSGTQPAAGSNAIVASFVKLDDRLGDAQEEAEIEGVVTTIDVAPSASAGEFVVAGVTVKTSAATKWLGGAPADLAVGVEVEAEGQLDSSGALVATKVSFRDSIRLQGAATDVVVSDNINGTFKVLGKTVQVTDATELKVALDLSTIAGNAVQVRGFPSADGATLVATRIESPSGAAGRIFVQGPVTAEGSNDLTVFGFTIDASAAQFRDRSEAALSATEFFDAVSVGTVVKARGADASALTGTTLHADEVELEDDR